MALTDNLVAYYKFDNGAITTDSVGTRTLTNNNAVAGIAGGKIGYGADTGTSNSNKWLSRDDGYGMTGATARTYAFWGKVNTTLSPGEVSLFFRHLYGGAGDGNYTNVSYLNSAGVYKLCMNSSPDTFLANYTMTVDAWYFFVVRVPANNTGSITLYANAASIGSFGNWAQNYAATTRIGMFSTNGPDAFSAVGIDEFGIWSRNLSDAEVTELYNGGAGLTYSGGAFVGGSNIKTVAGLAYASVKTVAGVAKASIKTIDGLA